MEVTLHSSDGLTSIELGVGTAAMIQTFEISPVPPGSELYNRVTISTVASNQMLHFVEFELYDLIRVNIALLGTASQSSTFGTSYASYGNDGVTAQIAVSNAWAGTNGAGTWTLDLDKSYLKSQLTKAIIYNRLGGAGEESRFAGATITLHSSYGLDPVEIGIGTADLTQRFVITENTVTLTPGISTMDITMYEVDGVLSYKIDIFDDVSGENVYSDTANDIEISYVKKLLFLTPDTVYTAKMYANYGSGFQEVGQESAQTLTNSPEKNNLAQFGDDGKYDLSSMDPSEFSQINGVLNDLFSTGETLSINLSGRTSRVAFVKLGEVVPADESVIAPFDSSNGSGQTFTLQLSDNSAIAIDYNETSNSITVGGENYHEGESFVLDGNKCYIMDV